MGVRKRNTAETMMAEIITFLCADRRPLRIRKNPITIKIVDAAFRAALMCGRIADAVMLNFQ